MEPPDRRRVRRLAGGRGRSRVGRRRLRDRCPERGDPGRRGAGVGGRDRSVCRLRRGGRGAGRRSSSPLRGWRCGRDPSGDGRGRRRGVGTRPQLRPGSRRGPRRDAPHHATGRCCGGLCLGLRGRHGAHPPVLGRRDRARPGGTRARRADPLPDLRARSAAARLRVRRARCRWRFGRSTSRRCSATSTTTGRRSSVALDRLRATPPRSTRRAAMPCANVWMRRSGASPTAGSRSRRAPGPFGGDGPSRGRHDTTARGWSSCPREGRGAPAASRASVSA